MADSLVAGDLLLPSDKKQARSASPERLAIKFAAWVVLAVLISVRCGWWFEPAHAKWPCSTPSGARRALAHTIAGVPVGHIFPACLLPSPARG
ncbi:hypothetical protein CBM2592_B110020 [Cupriavidus taiwanensis]|nr:hypothetical protein CBM2588_B140014 [Cupriavidus taiwanensis]SOY63468.1 hypothetical protein CBM2592_B110020 [Cupriavidus taiwanensis]SOY98458.1 hypothetical protein CBM2591_B90020 [Cupriavidus taiwanensis]SOZ77316.1 hypothetical protein CBM2617_U10086 [Cupriavidus taiwanensis]SOZ88740.1 hypothetical protein CBM2622_B140109 [Cupriavidus taiwanensis]